MQFIKKSFQVENSLVDEVMGKLSGNELKCYLLILRKTRGWRKEQDAISLSQFMKFTKLSKSVVIKCCKSLIKLGLIVRSRGRQAISIFKLIVQKIYSTSIVNRLTPSTFSKHTKTNVLNTNINTRNNFCFKAKKPTFLNKNRSLMQGIREYLRKGRITPTS